MYQIIAEKYKGSGQADEIRKRADMEYILTIKEAVQRNTLKIFTYQDVLIQDLELKGMNLVYHNVFWKM